MSQMHLPKFHKMKYRSTVLTNITFHLQLDERLEHSYYWLLLDNGLISNILLFKNINKKKRKDQIIQ